MRSLQAHRLGEPALYGQARAVFFEVRPEAEHARQARRRPSDLAQVEVPKRIVLNATVVTADNVEEYSDLCFES